MNNDDVIRMAREAGYGDAMADLHAPALERFAKLVASAEREACAAICDTEADEFGGMSDGFYAAKNCAEAIRARGERND